MSFDIKKGVPVPPRGKGKAKSGLLGVLLKMEVGDMVETRRELKSVASTAYEARKSSNFKYTTRTLSKGLVGVWRVE